MVIKPASSTSIVSHKEIINITKPAYLLGLFGGVITLAVSLFLLVGLYKTGNFALFDLDSFSILNIIIISHIFISVLMLLSVYLLRREHHCLSGSIMLLCSSIIGLTIASGLMIGPVLGIVGGILGMTEHEKLIKRHFS